MLRGIGLHHDLHDLYIMKTAALNFSAYGTATTRLLVTRTTSWP